MNKNIFTRGLFDCDPQYNIRVIACLVAAEVLMSFSPMGFIVLPSISVSTVYMGVMVSALWGGPMAGAYVGLTYGLCSMWKASVTATNPNDLIFSPLYSTNPAASWVLALVPRILFGVLCGFAFIPILKIRKRSTRLHVLLLSSLLLERIHSALTYWFMELTFNVPGGFFKAFTHVFTVNRMKTWVILMLTVYIFYIFYEKILSRRYYEEYLSTRNLQGRITWRYFALTLAAWACLSTTSIHFVERQQIVLLEIDGIAPSAISFDRMYQVMNQFALACICAIYIIATMSRHDRLVAELSRQKIALDLQEEVKLSKKMEQMAIHDPLTGLYNREGLSKIVDRDDLEHRPVTFALVDVDHFKEINDTLGHDEGDHVLKTIGKRLKQEFGHDHVFRLGGDEFVLLVRENIEKDPASFFDRFPPITIPAKDAKTEHNITFSVGACTCKTGLNEQAYPIADRALYKVKNNGRNGAALVNEAEELLYIHNN